MTAKKTARFAGVSYLFIIIFGIFSHMIVRGSVVVANDPVQSAANILNQELMFRMSIVSDLLMVLSYFTLGLLLYSLLKPFHKQAAIILLGLNIIGASMMALNMTNQYMALYVLKGSPYLNAFGVNQLQSASLFFMNFHGIGYKMATISYGLWLVPMGYLGLKSSYFPKTISYLLVVGGITYILSLFTYILGVQIPFEITIPADLGEFSLCLWLLIRGVKEN